MGLMNNMKYLISIQIRTTIKGFHHKKEFGTPLFLSQISVSLQKKSQKKSMNIFLIHKIYCSILWVIANNQKQEKLWRF